MRHLKNLIWALAGLTCALAASAGPSGDALSRAEAQSVVHTLRDLLESQYPFPEISHRYAEALQASEKAGAFFGVAGPVLAGKLNDTLQRVHKDFHLRVKSDGAQFKLLTQAQPEEGESAEDQAPARRANFGFTGVEIDPVLSVGYVNAAGPFYANQEAFETASAAMNMVARADYVMIDLRANPGGSGQMGRFLASYFFEAGDERFYLNGFLKDRSKDEQEWTYAFVPGTRNPKAKVYLLVGPRTGSAAEGLAFALQKMHRATVVGEATAGAGIAGSYLPLAHDLIVFLPTKMVVAPNSQTGWEGAGVIPDVASSAAGARDAAGLEIARDIRANSRDPAARIRAQWVLDGAPSTPVNGALPTAVRYRDLVGQYNQGVQIVRSDDGLVWRKTLPDGTFKDFAMRELKRDVFVVVDLNKEFGSDSTRIYVQRTGKAGALRLEKRVLLEGGRVYVVPEAYQLVH